MIEELTNSPYENKLEEGDYFLFLDSKVAGIARISVKISFGTSVQEIDNFVFDLPNNYVLTGMVKFTKDPDILDLV